MSHTYCITRCARCALSFQWHQQTTTNTLHCTVFVVRAWQLLGNCFNFSSPAKCVSASPAFCLTYLYVPRAHNVNYLRKFVSVDEWAECKLPVMHLRLHLHARQVCRAIELLCLSNAHRRLSLWSHIATEVVCFSTTFICMKTMNNGSDHCSW